MTWVKLDDKLHRNDKARSASDAAFKAWILSWSYCADMPQPTGYMTVREACDFVRSLKKPARVIQELVELRCWDAVEGGYVIHDFEQGLPQKSTERVKAWRDQKRLQQQDGTVSQHHVKQLQRVSPHARAVPEPDPVPVPVVTTAPPGDKTRPAVVLLEDPALDLQVWWHGFIGRQISEHDKQAAAAFVVEYPRLGIRGIQARITEHATWRVEHNKPALGKLEFYRDTLRSQETALADRGVPKPRERSSSGLTSIAEVLAR